MGCCWPDENARHRFGAAALWLAARRPMAPPAGRRAPAHPGGHPGAEPRGDRARRGPGGAQGSAQLSRSTDGVAGGGRARCCWIVLRCAATAGPPTWDSTLIAGVAAVASCSSTFVAAPFSPLIAPPPRHGNILRPAVHWPGALAPPDRKRQNTGARHDPATAAPSRRRGKRGRGRGRGRGPVVRSRARRAIADALAPRRRRRVLTGPPRGLRGPPPPPPPPPPPWLAAAMSDLRVARTAL